MKKNKKIIYSLGTIVGTSSALFVGVCTIFNNKNLLIEKESSNKNKISFEKKLQKYDPAYFKERYRKLGDEYPIALDVNEKNAIGYSTKNISYWKKLIKYNDGSYDQFWDKYGDLRTAVEGLVGDEEWKISDYKKTNKKYIKLNVNKFSQDVGYEIFIRSFADSDGDGIGDFRGVANKVKYLKDLGVTRVWMMPWVAAPSLHKYDALDFFKVDPEYGTMDDFKYMMKTLTKNNIKVDMDLAFNHTSIYSWWFKDFIHDTRISELLKSSKNEKKSLITNLKNQIDERGNHSKYYRYKSKKEALEEGIIGFDENNNLVKKLKGWYDMPDGKGGYYFAAFGSGMPDLNLDNRNLIYDLLRVVDYWKHLGVSGFRFDAPKEIFDVSIGQEIPGMTKVESERKNNEFWKNFTNSIENTWPGTYMVGENWTGSNNEMKSLIQPFSEFGFVWKNKIITMVNRGTVYDKDSHGLGTNEEEQFANDVDYFKRYNPQFMFTNFLSNHDRPRIRNSLGIFSGKDEYKAFVAANLMMALPGMPMIYYGDEVMMNGYDDAKKFPDSKDTMFRLSMPWGKNDAEKARWVNNKSLGSPETYYDTYQEYTTKSIKNNPNNLLEHYKKLISFRKKFGLIFQEGVSGLSGKVQPHNQKLGSGTDSDFTAWNDSIFGLKYSFDKKGKKQEYIVLVNLKNGWSSKTGGYYVAGSNQEVELMGSVGEVYNNLPESNNKKFSMGPRSIALFKVKN